MRKILLFLSVVMLLAGCVNSELVTDEDLAAYEVKQTFDEQREEDFIFRLVSEKETYQEGEEVELYGEIIYTGEENLLIAHAASAVIFQVKEEVRGLELSFAVPEIGMQTELIPNEPYRENYDKRGVFSSELDSEQYIEFVEKFTNNEGFPAGYYKVEATTAFYDGNSHREIKAEVDFKVMNEE